MIGAGAVLFGPLVTGNDAIALFSHDTHTSRITSFKSSPGFVEIESSTSRPAAHQRAATAVAACLPGTSLSTATIRVWMTGSTGKSAMPFLLISDQVGEFSHSGIRC